MTLFDISSAFNEKSLEKYNIFFGSPSHRVSMSDKDVMMVVFVSRALRLFDAVQVSTSWLSQARPAIAQKISKSIVAVFGKTHETEVSIAFRYSEMNETERAFSLISAVENYDAVTLNAIFATSNDEVRVKLINFMIRLLEFRYNYDPYVKASGDAAQKFLRCVHFVEDKMRRCNIYLDSLNRIKAYGYINLRDFGRASDALNTITGDGARKLQLEVQLKKSALEGDFDNAEQLAFKLINLSLCTISNRKSKITSLQFSASQCLTALRQTYNILDQNKLDPFLISGTLLGFVREGKIFDHDKDFDIAVIGWEKQYSIFESLYKSNAYTLDVRKLRGNETFTFSALHRKTGVAFDIFFLHPVNQNLLHGVDLDMGFTHHFLFSSFDLEVRNFNQDYFRVPIQYKKFLSENYGNGWSVPDPGYEVLLEAPAIFNKTGPQYRLMALLRLINALTNGDVRAVKRIISFLSELDFSEREEFSRYIRTFPLEALPN